MDTTRKEMTLPVALAIQCALIKRNGQKHVNARELVELHMVHVNLQLHFLSPAKLVLHGLHS